MSTADVIILVMQADQVTRSACSGDDKNNRPFNLPLLVPREEGKVSLKCSCVY